VSSEPDDVTHGEPARHRPVLRRHRHPRASPGGTTRRRWWRDGLAGGAPRRHGGAHRGGVGVARGGLPGVRARRRGGVAALPRRPRARDHAGDRRAVGGAGRLDGRAAARPARRPVRRRGRAGRVRPGRRGADVRRCRTRPQPPRRPRPPRTPARWPRWTACTSYAASSGRPRRCWPHCCSCA